MSAPLRAPTLTADGKRKWIYPDRRQGAHARRRGRLAYVLMAVYLTVPWLSVGGLPLLRFDVLGGRLFVVGSVLRFADAAWLAFVLVGLALLLFFATALRGRIWCGYACPQTVFVEWLIRPIEELIEGPANHRRAVDRGPWTMAKATRKVLKHGVFLLVAAGIANTFLAYFVPPADLLAWALSSPREHPGPFLVMLAVLLAFYCDLAWFREQFCSFLCPYARFQAVMMDKWTPVVAYDEGRGEPRGKRAAGACIDCGLCQRVCPTGIDIRDGLQLECIQCHRCTDACDMVMASLALPAGLIRAATQAELEGDAATVRFRPRVWLYGAAMVVAFALVASRLWLQPSLTLRFSRQPGSSFSQLPDGRFTNYFTLRSVNESAAPLALDFDAATPGVDLVCGSCATALPAFASAVHLVVVIVPADSAGRLAHARLRHRDSGETFDLPLLIPSAARSTSP